MFDGHFYHIFHTGTEIKSWIVPIKESSFKSFVSHSPCKTMIYTAPNRNMRFPSHEAPTFPDFSALPAPYCHSLHKQRDQNSGLPTSPSLPSTLRRDKTWDIFGSWPTWVFPFSTAWYSVSLPTTAAMYRTHVSIHCTVFVHGYRENGFSHTYVQPPCRHHRRHLSQCIP